MTVKIIGYNIEIKKTICRECNAILEYIDSDILTSNYWTENFTVLNKWTYIECPNGHKTFAAY